MIDSLVKDPNYSYLSYINNPLRSLSNPLNNGIFKSYLNNHIVNTINNCTTINRSLSNSSSPIFSKLIRSHSNNTSSNFPLNQFNSSAELKSIDFGTWIHSVFCISIYIS
jgi:hypothetical protein